MQITSYLWIILYVASKVSLVCANILLTFQWQQFVSWFILNISSSSSAIKSFLSSAVHVLYRFNKFAWILSFNWGFLSNGHMPHLLKLLQMFSTFTDASQTSWFTHNVVNSAFVNLDLFKQRILKNTFPQWIVECWI